MLFTWLWQTANLKTNYILEIDGSRLIGKTYYNVSQWDCITISFEGDEQEAYTFINPDLPNEHDQEIKIIPLTEYSLFDIGFRK